MGTPQSASIVEQMQADLTVAMKARDRSAVTAIRTGLAAIANAEAPPVGAERSSLAPPVTGLVEHDRLELTTDDVDRILRHEIDDRRDTIATIEGHGRVDEAEVLRAEIATLERYLT